MIQARNETQRNWSFMWPGDMEHVYYEDGTKRDLATGDYVVTFGKYSGTRMDEMSDVGYIQWLQKSAVEKGDALLEKVCTMRLYELQQ